MEDRNMLFRKAHALLMEEGAGKEEARSLVKETLRQGKRPSGGSSSNSGKGKREVGSTCFIRVTCSLNAFESRGLIFRLSYIHTSNLS